MEFEEFDRRHRNQCRDDGCGWFEACYTMDGRKRLRHAVRACDPDCRCLGESVHNGIDGRLSGDIRRWPQSILSEAGFGESSRIALMNVRQNDVVDDRGVTHASCYGAKVDVYRRAPRGYILRHRSDTDGRHVQMQIARSVRDASEWRQCLVDANLRDLAETANFPTGRDERYVESFLRDNPALAFGDVRVALRPRPGVLRVPKSNACSLTTTAWQTSSAPLFVADDPRVRACILVGVRTLQSSARCTEGDLVTLAQLVHEGDFVTAVGEGGHPTIRWQRDAATHKRQTAEDVRAYVLRLASPQVIGPARHAVRYEFAHSDDVTTIVTASSGGQTGTSTLRVGPYRCAGGGFVFCTDEGLRTGFPLTHRADTTTCLDAIGRGNDLDNACLVRCEGDPRMAMCAALKGMSTLDRTAGLMVADDANPLGRARFAAILKAAPVVDGTSMTPEHETVLRAGDLVSLTPDEKNVRIRGRSDVVPLLHNVSPPPAFADALAFNQTDLSAEQLDALLEDGDRGTQTGTHRVRASDGSALRAEISLTSTWTSDDNLVHRRRLWRNRHRALRLAVDRFVPIDGRRSAASGFSIATEAGLLFFDNRKHKDPRLLVLPQRPVYRSTGAVGSLMLRPMPGARDVKSMLAFCLSDAANEIFNDPP